MTTVKRLLQKKGAEVWTIQPEISVLDALRVLRDKNVGALPIIDQGEVIGIFSERDYARKCCQTTQIDLRTPVKEFMTSPVIFVNVSDSIEDCMRTMTNHHIRHLPVLENGRLSGIISIGDVVKEVISDREFLIQNLETYIAGTK